MHCEQTSDGAAKHDRARILSIGGDPTLLHSRRLVLETDGYVVGSLRSDIMIEEKHVRDFDLILLCHTIPDNVRKHILEVLARISPQIPVLLITLLDVPAPCGPHQTAVSSHPVALLAAVAQQLAMKRTPGLHGRV